MRTGFCVAFMIVLLAACKDRKQSNEKPSAKGIGTPSSVVTPTPIAASAPVDKWVGQWTGPEGTYLLLSKKDDEYIVNVRSLDGVESYEGVSTGDGIQFKRNGIVESIHAGNGEDTGMKWLLDKKDCLIIKAGEGFCRE